jgi:hypothetical protein
VGSASFEHAASRTAAERKMKLVRIWTPDEALNCGSMSGAPTWRARRTIGLAFKHTSPRIQLCRNALTALILRVARRGSTTTPEAGEMRELILC